MVRQWQEVLPDLQVDAVGTAKRLVRISEELARIGGAALEPFDLDIGEFDVLATLMRVGPPHRLSPTALFQALLVSSSGMTKRVDRLEARHLVRREDDPGDRRSRLVVLTVDGIRLSTAAVRAHAAACTAAIEQVDAGTLTRLRADLAELLETMERARP
jgi:DNA-binding MarR family transcriptional regulator